MGVQDQGQRHNIFHARRNIIKDVCSIIINCESCAIATTATLIEKLNLPTNKYLTPYRL